ncbi:hypothetical protein ACJ2PR_20445 [Phormidesmis sp. 146-33]
MVAEAIGEPMLSEQQLIEKWRKLPAPQQQQVSNFVELLESQEPEINNTLPIIEIWSPYESYAAAQDLLTLLKNDPGECAV